jgi:hypothetical protein
MKHADALSLLQEDITLCINYAKDFFDFLPNASYQYLHDTTPGAKILESVSHRADAQMVYTQ